MVVKPPPAKVVGRRAAVREVEGSSPTQQNSAPTSAPTEPTFLSSSARVRTMLTLKHRAHAFCYRAKKFIF